jgi:hypothetical protein
MTCSRLTERVVPPYILAWIASFSEPLVVMGEMARWTFTQRYIAERTRDIDPRRVEARMRTEHPTLDGLTAQRFNDAIEGPAPRRTRRVRAVEPETEVTAG